MVTSKQIMNHANECVRLARLTEDIEVREQLFALARQWTAAAMIESGRKGRNRIGGVNEIAPDVSA